MPLTLNSKCFDAIEFVLSMQQMREIRFKCLYVMFFMWLVPIRVWTLFFFLRLCQEWKRKKVSSFRYFKSFAALSTFSFMNWLHVPLHRICFKTQTMFILLLSLSFIHSESKIKKKFYWTWSFCFVSFSISLSV